MNGYEYHLSRTGLNEDEKQLIRAYLDDYSAMVSPGPDTLLNKYFLLYSLICICKESGLTLPDVTTNDILRVVAVIKNRTDYSDNYRRMLVSLLKSLCNHIPNLDMKKISSIKLPKTQWKTKKPEDMLTKEEVQTVISSCENSRDRCLISMVYDGSNRVIELLRLDWKDLIHDSMGYYFETDAKTGHKRKIRFTSSIPHIEQWQKDYSAHGMGKAEGDNPVFITLHDPRNRMSKSAYEKRIYDLKKRTGITKLKPGIMRSTRITHDVAAGQDVQYIMLKNWGNLKTSMLDRYTNLSGEYIDAKAMEYAGLKKAEKVKTVDPMQPVQCPQCFTINEAGFKHCRECGKSLTAEGDDEKTKVMNAMTPEEWIAFWKWRAGKG